MADITKKNIGAGLDVRDIGLLAGAKVLTERLSKNYIGNASLKSGLIKLGGALAIASFVKQKQVRYMAAGAGLDGAEDLVQVAFEKTGVEKSNNSSNGSLRAVL